MRRPRGSVEAAASRVPRWRRPPLRCRFPHLSHQSRKYPRPFPPSQANVRVSYTARRGLCAGPEGRRWRPRSAEAAASTAVVLEKAETQ